MKTRLFGVPAVCLTMLGIAAQASDAGVESTIAAFGAAFNKGDIAASKATMVPAPMITDEVATYGWRGRAAFATWLADLGKSDAAEGKIGGVVAMLDDDPRIGHR